MNGYLDDGELPADFLAQYPVAQDESPAEPSSTTERRMQEHQNGNQLGRYPTSYLGDNQRHEIDDWYIDDRAPWRRGLVVIVLLMAACMICGLWSM